MKANHGVGNSHQGTSRSSNRRTSAPAAVASSKKEESAELPEPPGPVTILLIYSIVESRERGQACDLVTDLETLNTAQAIADALRVAGHEVTMAAIRSEEDVIAAVARVDPNTTLVFNLCETLQGISSLESRVPWLLDKSGFNYVGATPENLDACLDKGYTKAQLSDYGIPTAPYQVFYTGSEPIEVPLPAIVKPVAEDCSLGITRDSVVHDATSLRRRVAYILDTYRQPALVEMFLDGREFNVSVWGNGTPYALPVSEPDYSYWDEKTLRVMNFDAKWNDQSPEYNHMPIRCPAPLDRRLQKHIQDIALAAYRTMGCRDYARVDMREKDRQIYVLEVNPNPCLAVDGGFAYAARVAGYDYAHMAHQIAEWAWWRVWHRRLR